MTGEHSKVEPVSTDRQIIRAVREIGKCLERAAAGEGIQLAAARGKIADLADWLSDKPASTSEGFTWMELDLIATETYSATANGSTDPLFEQVYQKAQRMKATAPGKPVRKEARHDRR